MEKQVVYFEVIYNTEIQCIKCESTADYKRKLERIRELTLDAEVVFRGYDDGSYEDGWNLDEIQ